MQVSGSLPEEGLRERKRRETLQRISEVGLGLFLAKGYDATTLHEIAAEAGISRRTFFYYFKSKDDIILAYIGGLAEDLKTEIKNTASHSPLDAVRDAMVKLSAGFEASKLLATARFMRESGALRIKQRNNSQFEQAVFEALCEVWPAKSRRARLRLVAIASIGANRVAVDSWLEQNGKRSLPSYFRDAFNDLKAEMGVKN